MAFDKEKELIIRIAPHTEGGLNYTIYVDKSFDDIVDDYDGDDGGICTSGMHDADCKNDNCEGCEEAMAKPYTRKDWANALGMAVGQSLDLMFPERKGGDDK